MPVNTDFLHTFLTICRHEGFGRAADELGVTQPAVSHQVKKLEYKLGVQLFERGGRTLILTAPGRRLFEFCERYFAELDALSETLTQETVCSTDPLHVSSVSGYGRYVLFPQLCKSQFRHLRLQLSFKTIEDVFRSVENGRVDLGFVYQTKVSNHLAFRQIHEEELVLIASTERASSLGGLKRMREVEALPFVTYEESDFVFGRWFDRFYGVQPGATSWVYHFEELEEVVEMVRLDRGVSIVPDCCVTDLIRDASLSIIRPRRKRCLNQVYSVVRAGAYLREEVRDLLERLSRGI